MVLAKEDTPLKTLAKQAKTMLQNRSPPLVSAVKSTKGLCFYHEKYGHKARTCKQPCKWKKRTPKINAINEDNSSDSENGLAGRL